MNTGTTPSKRERQKQRTTQRREQQQRRQQQARRRTMLRAVVLVVVGLGVVVALAIFMARGSDVSLGVDEPTVAADANALQPPPEAGDDPVVGMPAPTVEGTGFDGDPVTLGGGAGAAQAIAFNAHWCPHCQAELPEVAGWVAAGALAEGVELVGVSTRHDPARPNWPPDDWFAEADWPGATFVDSTEAAAETYGLAATPYWVFVDADGTVVARVSGRIDESRFAELTALAAP